MSVPPICKPDPQREILIHAGRLARSTLAGEMVAARGEQYAIEDRVDAVLVDIDLEAMWGLMPHQCIALADLTRRILESQGIASSLLVGEMEIFLDDYGHGLRVVSYDTHNRAYHWHAWLACDVWIVDPSLVDLDLGTENPASEQLPRLRLTGPDVFVARRGDLEMKGCHYRAVEKIRESVLQEFYANETLQILQERAHGIASESLSVPSERDLPEGAPLG